MPDDDRPGKFDPRFDPAFQPGFDPSKHAARPVPRWEEQTIPQAAAESFAPEQADPANPPDDSEDQAVESNPFERILVVVGAVLVVGGVAMAFWANGVNYSHSAIGSPWTWQDLLQTTAWTLAAPTVTIGLAIGVGLLFRRAITWNREK